MLIILGLLLNFTSHSPSPNRNPNLSRPMRNSTPNLLTPLVNKKQGCPISPDKLAGVTANHLEKVLQVQVLS